MPPHVTCPVCGLADQVEKVSTLYLVGLELAKRPQRAAANSQAETSRALELLRARQLAQPKTEPLHRKLAPPSSGKQTTIRPIHPDQAVLAFSLLAPFFLYGILTSQASSFLPVLGVLAAAYGLYFWQRRRLIARFEREQARQKGAARRIVQAIEGWMKLYYCAREELVFEPGAGTSAPVDQMMGYLVQDAGET